MKKVIIVVVMCIVFVSLGINNRALALQQDDLKGVLNENTLKSILSLDIGGWIKKGSDFIAGKTKSVLPEESEESKGDTQEKATGILSKLKEIIKKIDWTKFFEKAFEFVFSILKSIFDYIKNQL